jgi:hypothetical protein
MMNNADLDARIGFDTAENELCEISDFILIFQTPPISVSFL